MKNRIVVAASGLVVVAAVVVGLALSSDLGSASPHLPGGTLELEGDLTDRSTGEVYGFELDATEDGGTAGVGDMEFQLIGANLSMCDAHGPDAVPGTTLAGFECVGSGNVSVRVDGCTAMLETHGIVHSDHPNTVYFGSMTVDITYQRNAGTADGRLSVVVSTPKQPITLEGDVSADPGFPIMGTCP